MDDRWFRLGDHGRYHALYIPPHIYFKLSPASNMTESNPYKTPTTEDSGSSETPNNPAPRSLAGSLRLSARAIVVFFFAFLLASGVVAVLYPHDSRLLNTGSLPAVASLLIAILLTIIDTIQYNRFLRKRDT